MDIYIRLYNIDDITIFVYWYLFVESYNVIIETVIAISSI